VTHDEAKALGLRALECDGFRWMPGMLDTGNERMLKAVGPMWDDTGVEGAEPHSNYPPDFRDPATLGCLLALVREAWGPHAHMTWAQFETGAEEWICWVSETRVFLADSEAEALVAALEAAP
jgi:hypothetical protein